MSFAWRGGEQRTTTGIWMWSDPFVKKIANGEEVAVLLMDTQVSGQSASTIMMMIVVVLQPMNDGIEEAHKS